MKKKVFVMFLFMLGMLLIVNCKQENPSGTNNQGAQSELIKLLPKDTQILLKFKSINNLYQNIPYIKDNLVSFWSPEIVEKVMIDIAKIESFEENGYSTTKEFAITLDEANTDKTPKQFAINIFVPYKDKKKAKDHFLNSFSKNKSNNVNVEDKGETIEVTFDQYKGIVYYEKGYMITRVYSNETNGFPKKYAHTQNLSQHEYFQTINKKLSINEGIFIYFNIKNILDLNKNVINDIQKSNGVKFSYIQYAFYKAIAFTVSTDNKDLVCKTSGIMDEESVATKMMQDVSYDKSVILRQNNKPVMFSSFSINAKLLHKYIMSSIPNEVDRWYKRKFLKFFKDELNIEFEEEFLQNLTTTMNFAIVDAKSINMMNYNLLLSLSIDDEAKMVQLLEKSFQNLNSQYKSFVNVSDIKGIKTYTINVGGMAQVYVGVNNKNLIVASSIPVYEAAISGKDKQLVTKYQDSALKNIIKNDNNLFFLDIQEVFQVYRNLNNIVNNPTADNIATKIKENYEYLYTTHANEKNDNTFFGEFKIVSKSSKPFFIGLDELINTIE